MQQELLEKAVTVKTPNLGFIGLGWIGRNRMEVFLQSGCANISSILEPHEENAKAAMASADKSKLVGDFDEMLNDPELDGIVIATPSAMHAEQSIKALQHGKAVFCQKPLGRTADEVKEVVEASQQSNRLLGVDLSYRHTEAMQAIYSIIQNGELGRIFAVDLTFHNAYGPDKPWFYEISQSGGGCVMDLGIHLVDLALWNLNFPEVMKVKSALYHKGIKMKSTKHYVEDYAVASMITENGASVNIQCSWNVSAGQDAVITVRFYGTKGGAAFKNINGSFYDFVAEKYEGTQRIGLVEPPDNWGGKAGVAWAKRLAVNPTFDPQSAEEFIKTAEVLDRIYGR